MLDLRSKKILKIIVDECSSGSYKIIDKGDLVLKSPPKYNITDSSIQKIIETLQKGEYITVKYSDDEQFCLSPTSFGRQFIENEDNKLASKKNNKLSNFKTYFLVAVFAFLGAFLGTMLYNLVM